MFFFVRDSPNSIKLFKIDGLIVKQNFPSAFVSKRDDRIVRSEQRFQEHNKRRDAPVQGLDPKPTFFNGFFFFNENFNGFTPLYKGTKLQNNAKNITNLCI